MKNQGIYVLWACLYILSALLGFIPEPSGLGAALLWLAGLAVFAPPAVLLYRERSDRTTLRCIRNLSLISLCATFALMIGNVLSVFLSRYLGDFLYFLLVICSAPMACMQMSLVSVFLWACLLMTSLHLLRKLGK